MDVIPLPDLSLPTVTPTSPGPKIVEAPRIITDTKQVVTHPTTSLSVEGEHANLKFKCIDITDHKKVTGIDRIAVFGYADCKPEDVLYHEVVCTTQALAKNGYTVVDGGGPGVMEAATVGAKLGGGKVIGVTFYPKDAKHFEGKDMRNVMDEEIITHNYVERTISLLERGQIYVIFNGGTGTISEFGMAWGLARIYFGHHKPLILYGEFWPEIISTFKKNMKIREEEMKVFKYAKTPHDVLTAISEFDKEIKSGQHDHLQTANGLGIGESAFIL